jgi:hypothetical protein
MMSLGSDGQSWVHLTFVEPASWLDWRGTTIIQDAAGKMQPGGKKISEESRRIPKNPLDKSKTRPANRQGKQAD